MESINNGLTDRENLEWLVYFCLNPDGPDTIERAIISISRGRELLGFSDMQDMREWLKGDGMDNFNRINNSERSS